MAKATPVTKTARLEAALRAAGAAIAAQDWAAAEAALRRAAEVAPKDARIAYNLAKVLVEGAAAAGAGRWFERAVAADPTYQIAWFELGRWRIAQDPYDPDGLAAAYTAFEQAAALDPNDADAWRNLGRLAERLGRWEAAQAAWERLPSDDAEAALGRARALRERGDPAAEPAIAALKARPELRAAVLKIETHTAKGRLCLRQSFEEDAS